MTSASGNTPGRKDRILVVEDDRSLREGVAMNLRMRGYELLEAADGDEGMRLAFDANPDLVILDIMLPGYSGLDIVEELRKRGRDVPVLVLSARNRPPDKVQGLDLGADDYLGKPFDLSELIARVQAMLRRRHGERETRPELRVGRLRIDPGARTVHVRDKPVALSAREFDLLALLATSPGQVFTREAILEHIWGWDYEGTARTVDNVVVSLRKKLGRGRLGRHDIRTVRGVGYKIHPAQT